MRTLDHRNSAKRTNTTRFRRPNKWVELTNKRKMEKGKDRRPKPKPWENTLPMK